MAKYQEGIWDIKKDAEVSKRMAKYQEGLGDIKKDAEGCESK